MKKIEMSQPRWIASMVGCALIGSVVGSVGLSFADGSRSTTNLVNNINKIVVPYDGYLMLDSAPVNGTQTMRFTLYESASGNTGQWAEAHNVTINDGRFSVTLGNGANVLSSTPGAPSPLPHATFNDAILDAEKLFIGIEVEDSNGNYIALAGRQAIEAAPFAAWSARSADFGVEGNLGVKGVARIDGELRPQGGIAMADDTNISGVDQITGFNDLRLSGSPTSGASNLRIDNVGNVSVSKALGVTGTTTVTTLDASDEVEARFIDGAILPRYQAWNSAGLGEGGASIYNDNGTYKALMFTGNNSSGLGRKVHVFDDMEVERDLLVKRNVRVNGEYQNFMNSVTLSDHVKDDAGTIDLIPVNEGFCALSSMQTGAGSTHQCAVTRNATHWRLYNSEGGGNFVNCEAQCMRFP